MRFACFLAALVAVVAQVPHTFDAYTPTFNNGVKTAMRVLPPMDIEASVARAEEITDLTKIFEFGQVNNVSVDFFKEAAQTTTESGTVYSLTFHMENALSMAFFFGEFDLPVGGAMYLVSEHEIAGPFTHENKWDNGALQTRHVRGNQVSVEYFETFAAKKALLPKFSLEVVTTAFRERGHNTKRAGICNINTVCIDPRNQCNAGCAPTNRACSVACTYFNQNVADGQWAGTNWEPQVRAAVALARTFNSRYCSGSFINNAEGRPLVLTAAHCNPGANDLIQVGFVNPDCTSTNDNVGDTSRTAGSLRTLARNTRIDNQLLEVGEALPAGWNIYLAGYDASDERNPATGVVGIHHPSGANKKISNSDVTVTPHVWSGTAPPLDHWRVATWSEATTEPGSSGSPLYNRRTQRIIGQLHGGSAACPARNGWDTYGAVWAGFSTGGMSQFLGSATVMDGREYRS